MFHYELLKQKIQAGFQEYDILYNPKLTESEDIEAYGTNEFFGGEREAYEDMLEFLEKLENKKV